MPQDKYQLRDTLPIRLLQIEDNPGDARYVHALLESRPHPHYEVTVAESLREAIHEISISNYHAILLDLTLPDSEGLDTLKSIRRRAPDKPIIVLTGNDEEDVISEALSGGAQHYLVKNKANSDMLMMSLQHAISQSKTGIRQYRKHSIKPYRRRYSL